MNIWNYLEKRSKRKSLEKLRQYYLGEYEELEDSIRYIGRMGWDRQTQIDQFKYMKNQSNALKAKAEEIEKQIMEL